MICDLYLGELSDQQLEELNLSSLGQLPSAFRFLAHIPDRVTVARDDLGALQWRSEIYDSFALRLTDPEATSDALVDQFRMRLPQGTTRPADNRDVIYHVVVGTQGRQQLINVMAAATLFRHKHNRYPDAMESLVPEFLTAIPTSLRDGQPFRIKPVGDGLVVYSAEDGRQVESDLQNIGTVQKDSTRYLQATAFLGEAYDRVYQSHAEPETASDSPE